MEQRRLPRLHSRALVGRPGRRPASPPWPRPPRRGSPSMRPRAWQRDRFADHVWVEHREKRVEVTAARGGKEGVDDFSLAGEIGVGNRGRSVPPPAPCTRRRARLASCRAAVGVRPTIGAISSKGTANMSCSTNASRSAGASVSRTTSRARPTESASIASCSGSVPASRLAIGSGMRVQGFLVSRLARAQHVEAHPGDDRRQPSTQILDATRAGATEAEPGFLNGVVRLAQRAEHPVGDRPEVGPVCLELLSQAVVFVHRSHSSVAFRHSSDERNPADVTAGFNTTRTIS